MREGSKQDINMGDKVTPFDVDGQWVDFVTTGVEHLLGRVSRE